MQNNNSEDYAPKRLLLYMDILGCRQIVRKGITEEILIIKEIVDFFAKMRCKMKIDYDNISKTVEPLYQITDFQPEISNFSDHIIASYPISMPNPPFDCTTNLIPFCFDSLLNIAAQVHRCALERKILMRGAITIGSLWHEGHIALGTALVEADELEKNMAIYPRVVIEEKIIEEYGSKLMSLHVRRDFDGTHFLDYSRHHAFVGVGSQLQKPLLKIHEAISTKLVDDVVKANIKKLSK